MKVRLLIKKVLGTYFDIFCQFNDYSVDDSDDDDGDVKEEEKARTKLQILKTASVTSP